MRTITCSRSFTTRVEPTENVQACAASFGIGVDEDIRIELYKDLDVRLGPGRIVFLTGESGAGKTTLLRDLRDRVKPDPDFRLIPEPDVRAMPDKPLVDQFGNWGLGQIGELLAFVGIAEAFVYLRKPRELSDGQRYRFGLAWMLYEAQIHKADGKTPILFVDEYLAFLDRETARNVAYQTRRVATKAGVCMVLATTHEDIRADLQPNTTVTLRLNIPPALTNTPLAGI